MNMNHSVECRVCLANDKRLYSILDVRFRDIYEKLVGSPLDTEDMFSTSVCYVCYSLMKKFLIFIDKAQKANRILQQMASFGLQPSDSSLDMLVQERVGLSWTLGISKIDSTTSPSFSSDVDIKVEVEFIKSEIDIDETIDRNEDAAPPEKWQLEQDEIKNESDDVMQTVSMETERADELGQNVEGNQSHSIFDTNNTLLLGQNKDKSVLYECQYCMKRFTSNYNLNSHVRVHTKEKPFKCDLCGKCFTQSAHYTRHLRVHSKEKPFQCEICKKSFSDGGNLTVHLRVHTKEKPFKCDTCSKCFSRNDNLMAHLRVHSKEKPFKCDVCEKTFSFNTSLIRHLRVHTDEKPFQCDLCEKRFSERAFLTKHSRVHKKNKPRETNNQAGVLDSPSIEES